MNSCLYDGWVRHRRHRPVTHEFRYRLFMLWLDLDELDRVFRGRWFWSVDRPNLACFLRRDHLGDPARPLAEAVRDLVEQRLGFRPAGPVRVLTHLRYVGYLMNPVLFHYCYEEGGRDVAAVVAEVHNTPWGETHHYVLDRRGEADHRFAKQFHVSPFMPMDQDYRWSSGTPGRRLTIHMENQDPGGRLFDATMVLRRVPITGPSLASVLVRFPFMTGRVVAAIYWQALRLWWKGAPFHPHPGEGSARA